MKQTFTALLFMLFLLQGCKNEDLSDVAGIADFQISEVSPSGLVPDTIVVDNPSQTITLLHWDAANERLRFTGRSMEAIKPTCVCPVPSSGLSR